MNGRRRKALIRQYQEQTGRKPTDAILGMRDLAEAKIGRDGVRRWNNAFDHHGLLVHVEKMDVIIQSEVRSLKRAYKLNA